MERTLYGKIHFDEAAVEAGEQLDYTYTNGTEHWLMVNRFSVMTGSESKNWTTYIRTKTGFEHQLSYDTDDTELQIGGFGLVNIVGIMLGPREIMGVRTTGATSEMHVSLVAYEMN